MLKGPDIFESTRCSTGIIICEVRQKDIYLSHSYLDSLMTSVDPMQIPATKLVTHIYDVNNQ